MKSAVAIRHVNFEDLGSLAAPLVSAGYSVRYVEAGAGEFASLDYAQVDLLIVLGGPIGVYEVSQYPFVAIELDILRQRLEQGRPTLGICLGAQLIAAALGAQVYPGPEKEIGWAPVELTTVGLAGPLAGLGRANVSVLHWHGDTFALPPGAVNLASTAAYRHQAFSVGNNILGLQFHLEVQPQRIEAWLVGHAAELAQSKINPAALRASTSDQDSSLLEGIAQEILYLWLEQLQ